MFAEPNRTEPAKISRTPNRTEISVVSYLVVLFHTCFTSVVFVVFILIEWSLNFSKDQSAETGIHVIRVYIEKERETQGQSKIV